MPTHALLAQAKCKPCFPLYNLIYAMDGEPLCRIKQCLPTTPDQHQERVKPPERHEYPCLSLPKSRRRSTPQESQHPFPSRPARSGSCKRDWESAVAYSLPAQTLEEGLKEGHRPALHGGACASILHPVSLAGRGSSLYRALCTAAYLLVIVCAILDIQGCSLWVGWGCAIGICQ